MVGRGASENDTSNRDCFIRLDRLFPCTIHHTVYTIHCTFYASFTVLTISKSN